MFISELVKQNDRVVFFPDVQLGWYPNRPENEGLARGYQWTSEKVGQSISSLDLLDKLRHCFINPQDSRLVAMATYGHGKTHLALALANFFGREETSEHVQAVLHNIKHVAPDSAANFTQFKSDRAPLLILRLSGEEGSLNGQVISGLQRALDEHPGTKGATLPFWFKAARAFLESLDNERLEKVNSALEVHRLDVPLLLSEITKGEVQYKGLDLHTLAREAHQAAYGTLPDFGGDTSLRQAIEWVCDEFCSADAADGKPCGGLLILFDEFAKFIEKYFFSPRGDSLQNLLNGVDAKRSLCAFVALSQFDPDQTARNIAEQSGRGGDALKSLSQELNRLPLPNRYLLHTSLETVLRSYLAQDAAHWQQFLTKPSWISALQDATNDTMALFVEKYGRYDEGEFTESITKACFPLHPATTAIISGAQLRETTSPRSALAFLQKALAVFAKQSVEKEGKPNWVRPIDIFDEEILPDFGEMLAEAGLWKQFQTARNRAGNERTKAQEAVLRAVLLHDAIGLKPRRVGNFESLAVLLTGLSSTVCSAAFEQLRESGTLRYDPTTKRWMFPPLGEDDSEIERELDKRLNGKTLDWVTLQKLQKNWEKTHLVPFTGFDLEWGNEEDWAAAPILLTRETYTPHLLRKLLQVPYIHSSGGLTLPPRGYVVRLLAQNDEDVTYLRDNAESVLTEAFPTGENTDKIPPVVVCVPSEARSFLVRLILKSLDLPLLKQEKPELGKNAYSSLESRLEGQIKREMKRLEEDVHPLIVPPAYQQYVKTHLAGQTATLPLTLRECYTTAYGQRPDVLLKQYPYARPTYRKDVGMIAKHLMRNNVSVLETDLKPGPGRSMIFDGSRVLMASWNLLSTHGYGVQEPPTHSRLRPGWDLLDAAFQPGGGSTKLVTLIETLLRPPYGYDPNALTFLLCAWYGFHAGDLSVTIGSRVGEMDELNGNIDKPWDWLWHLCNKGVAWSRRNPDEDRAVIRSKIERVQKNEIFKVREASNLSADLRHYANDENETDKALQKQAERCAKLLDSSLEKAAKYDAGVERIEQKVAEAKRVRDVVTQLDMIRKLPELALVHASQPGVEKIQARALEKMTSLVESDCIKWEQLPAITDYKAHYDALIEIERELTAGHRLEFLERVRVAKDNLKTCRDELQAESQDAGLLAEVNGMLVVSGLQALREARSRLDKLEATAVSDKAREVVQHAQTAISAKVAQLEEFAAGLEVRLDSLASVQAASTLRDGIMSQSAHFQDTPEAAILESAAARCHSISDLWRAIETLETQRSAAIEKGAHALEKWDTALRELSTHEDLNTPLRERLVQGETSAREAKESARHKASQWLQDRRESANRLLVKDDVSPERLSHLLGSLGNIPVWLDDSQQAAVAALQARIEARQSELEQKRREQQEADDVAAIVYRFRSIRDAQQRAAVLAQLQALQRELESVCAVDAS